MPVNIAVPSPSLPGRCKTWTRESAMADSPVITCPECRKKFKGKPGLAGKKIKCPLCAKPFVVPGEKKVEAVAKGPMEAGLAPLETAPAPPLSFAEEEEDDANPY